jgi:hypothetical protein
MSYENDVEARNKYLEETIKNMSLEIDQLEKYQELTNKVLIKTLFALSDYYAYGTRHDTNPTTIMTNETKKVICEMYNYLEGMDRYVRETSKETLKSVFLHIIKLPESDLGRKRFEGIINQSNILKRYYEFFQGKKSDDVLGGI